MKRWIDENDYSKISYVTHDSKPSKVIISVKKGTIFIKDLVSIKHGKLPFKSGA